VQKALFRKLFFPPSSWTFGAGSSSSESQEET
jgi:hypothetical protein